jgi:hypothetical protein
VSGLCWLAVRQKSYAASACALKMAQVCNDGMLEKSFE